MHMNSDATFREIETSSLVPAPLRDQPAPMLEWVKIDNLRIDTRYQRPLEKRNLAAIQKIADSFDWCAFGPILCAPIAGGLYAVIDGQHRAHAAALCGIEAVPAMIVPVPSREQAVAFVRVNSGIRVFAHQTLRAELAAGDPVAVAMQRAVEDAGCELLTYNPHSASRRPRTVTCVGFVRKVIKSGRGPALTAALRGIVLHDTTGSPALYSDYVLVPLVAAVAGTACEDPNVIARALNARRIFIVLDQATKAATEKGIAVAPARVQAVKNEIVKAMWESAA